MVNNICKHFGLCGGCSLQDKDYLSQIKAKEQRLSDILNKFGIKTQLKPTVLSEPYYYRNKMEFTFFSYSEGKIGLGLHRRGKNLQLINLEECLIFSEDIGEILAFIRDFFQKQGCSVYNKLNHKGFLRHLIIRESKLLNERMVVLVTTSEGTFNQDEFVTLLKKISKKNIVSVYWVINNSWSDAVVFQEKKLLFGSEFIQEKLGNFVFQIGPETFFQVNPKSVEKLYRKLDEYLSLKGQEKILDLYCGVGSIALNFARQAKFIWAVELSPSAIFLANKNAQNNNISNVSFICEDTRKFLAKAKITEGIDYVIVNPPRGGLSKKVRSRIININAKKIFYSSCNPKTLIEDISFMNQDYKIAFLEPFDFFPHTPHIEVLAMLEKFN